MTKRIALTLFLIGPLFLTLSLILLSGGDSFSGSGPAPIKITIEPLNPGPGPLSDFPVLVRSQTADREIHFTLPDDRTVLASEVTSYDPQKGEITAWVRIPSVPEAESVEVHLHHGKPENLPAAGVWDEHHKIVKHLGKLRYPDLELPRTGALVFKDAITVEAWVYSDESRAEALLPLVSKWAPRESMTAESFSAYDAGKTDGLDCFMYYGAVFDGRFVYFCPIRSKLRDRLSVHAHVLRYDTHKDFYSPQSWEAYDAGSTDGLRTVCYYGAVFDGRYVFFTPRDEGTGYHSRVLRLDTTQPFKDPRSWQAFDADLTHSKQSGAFDGRYIYFCPGYDGTTLTGKTLAEDEGQGSGKVLRLDTRGDFRKPSTYQVFDAKAVSPDAVCFDGAAFDGRYVYFAPLQRGGALRYDTTADFSNPASWEFFDARPLGMKACVGVVFDGRHMYYVAYGHSTMLRFDTRLPFRDSASWGSYEAANTGGLDTGGFDGAFFDGRYIVFVPWIRTIAPGENKNRVHANFLRYDTQGLFSNPKSWDSYNAERTDGLVSRGYNGGAFDGRFFYGAPMYDGESANLHGRILRYDSTGKNGTFSLRWSDVGHNGGLCAAVPGPNFLVNTENGALSIAAHRVLSPGWHHLAGVYDRKSIKLYIDGVLAGEREGSGSLISNLVDIEIGRIQNGAARFPGIISEVRVSDIARSGSWIAAAYKTLARSGGAAHPVILQGQGLQAGPWQLYPSLYPAKPEIASPLTLDDGNEIILVVTKDDQYGLVGVKVENGGPLHYSKRAGFSMGKDRQLEIDEWDFPALAENGLHDEAALEKKEEITGFPIGIITAVGRPRGFSASGFMAADEDVISVLKGDNELVRSMGMIHPQLARPLFHVWNLVLREIEVRPRGRFDNAIKFIYYNGHKLSFRAVGTKGWQVSIFQDEIQGSFDFDVSRELTADERDFLNKRYSRLSEARFAELVTKLSSVHFSEMLPYYIMRYGFYEGHNPYRCDPVALAFIFGLRSLVELDGVFDGKLDDVLTAHFVSD